MSDRTRVGILMICMGNICRSPLAEGIFRHKINRLGIADRFHVDSAGTGGWHAGEPPDARARATAANHGIRLSGRARKVRRDDFARFDHLLCMDESNREAILEMGAPEQKVRLLLEFMPEGRIVEVPDPYYGGDDGFELAFNLIDRACDGLIEALLAAKR